MQGLQVVSRHRVLRDVQKSDCPLPRLPPSPRNHVPVLGLCKQLQPPHLLEECSSCSILLCRADYIRMGNVKQCPSCKTCPWLRRKDIDPVYKKVFDVVRIKCQLCKPENEDTYNYHQLWEHIEKVHPGVALMPQVDRHELVNYSMVSQENQEDVLELSSQEQVYLNHCARDGISTCTFYRNPIASSLVIDLSKETGRG